jgi:hypothetical protein
VSAKKTARRRSALRGGRSPTPNPLTPFAPLLSALASALMAAAEAMEAGDLEMLWRGVSALRNACVETEWAIQKARLS